MPRSYFNFSPQKYGIAPNMFAPNTEQFKLPSFDFSAPGAGGGGGVPGGGGIPGGGQEQIAGFPPEFFNFEQPNIDKFSSHMDALPQRSDHNPGAMDRVLAALIGGVTGFSDPSAGVGAARDHLERPYNQAVQDWSLKAQSLEGMAGLDIETSQNKAAILQAIQAGDIDRLKLILEQQKIMGQTERWQGQTAGEMGQLGVDQAELGLQSEELGLNRERSGAYRDLSESRGGYYDAMADKAGRTEQGGFDAGDEMDRSDLALDPNTVRAYVPMELQKFFVLNENTGYMDLTPSVGSFFTGGRVSEEDRQGYAKAQEWYRNAKLYGPGNF